MVVCLSFCLHAYIGNHTLEIHPRFSVHVVYGPGSVLLWWRCNISYVLPVYSMLSCFHILGPIWRLDTAATTSLTTGHLPDLDELKLKKTTSGSIHAITKLLQCTHHMSTKLDVYSSRFFLARDAMVGRALAVVVCPWVGHSSVLYRNGRTNWVDFLRTGFPRSIHSVI